MRVENLFKKDIFRSINGVVKADQLDESSVWQELDEFVVTKELDQHLQRFISSYCEALDDGNNPDVAEKVGVWVSGFFGSGKSHFVKVLSYLLDNEEHSFEGQTKRAVEFFDSKITDPMLLADIKKAAASDVDVILFNIDSKADSHGGRDAILAVFLKVFNEMLGFSGDHAHIAHMERYLSEKGKFRDFQAAYQELTDTQWIDERDAWEFNRDQVVDALSTTLGQSTDSCEKWVDGAEDNFSLNVENFAEWVREYLDSQGPDHRIVFLVDEVGQFIGTDSHLMLNLQTITEELGTLCQGRAWIVVTSQEDIDAVLGEVGTSKANDFSKIQGRFKTRLSLSSANVDEVIQERLLKKRDEVIPELTSVFKAKGDIIKNQLTFKSAGMTFKKLKDAEDFARNYPFAPYQFRLLQKIFESIRRAGATGLHLAQGERSLLDAFQSAGKALANEEIGVLAPLYLFYPSIESFLDTTVKQTIDHARGAASLEPFDVHLLEVLFLIRYVDEVKGSVDNLVTLCLNEIDEDRVALKKGIEAGLHRLESESLISRSGDTYFFLTNEERDINREIKNVEVSGGEEAKFLGDLIFGDVLKEQRKHRYSVNKMDFQLNRICDGHPFGPRADSGLNVSAISPLADNYDSMQESQGILESNQDGGQVLARLRDDGTLGREVRRHLKTDKYLRTKDDGTLPPSAKRIHRDLAEENRQRRERLTVLLGEMFTEASFYVAGQKLEVKSTGPPQVLSEAMEYLIRNTFKKMGYIQQLRENPFKEIHAVLKGADTEQGMIDLSLPANNPEAIAELRSYIELCDKGNKQIVVHNLILKFSGRPWGWPSLETVLLLARLHIAGEIQFIKNHKAVAHQDVYDAITTSSQWRKVIVDLRQAPPIEEIQRARALGKKVFSEMGPDTEEALFEHLRHWLESWRSDLQQHQALADTGKYPGKQEIDASLSLAKSLLNVTESNKFIPRFNKEEEDLLELSDNFHELDNFYSDQKPTWERLREAAEQFALNKVQLDANEAATTAMRRMSEILGAPAPYGLLQETDPLIATVRKANEELVQNARIEALQSIQKQKQLVEDDLDLAKADDPLRILCLKPLDDLVSSVRTMVSIAHIQQSRQFAVGLREKAEERISGKDGPGLPTTTVVLPKTLVTKTYIENSEEIDDFLRELRKILVEAIESNLRIEIR